MEPPPKQGCEDIYFNQYYHIDPSQWNPRRSRGARERRAYTSGEDTRLSGTPAEAGVRVLNFTGKATSRHVSVEPPPKQGCEAVKAPKNGDTVVSVEPPPKQGCEAVKAPKNGDTVVSVEPPPKQGCEARQQKHVWRREVSQWNPRRSRGARETLRWDGESVAVSVEPPPKQGCEVELLLNIGLEFACLSGTPAEAGVRVC